jgi:hypothetical protein
MLYLEDHAIHEVIKRNVEEVECIPNFFATCHLSYCNLYKSQIIYMMSSSFVF